MQSPLDETHKGVKGQSPCRTVREFSTLDGCLMFLIAHSLCVPIYVVGSVKPLPHGQMTS